MGKNSDESPCSVAAFVVNSEPHTGARPSVRLCVGPVLARCIYHFITRCIYHFITKIMKSNLV
jgi:hypothetical protein